ncbi:glycoside hydrolase, partial [Aureobasidium melanogenum]
DTDTTTDYENYADTTYVDVLAGTLQSLFKTSTPDRYISASPLCANNTVLPWGFYQNANFIWPRFYNANACKAGGKGYNNSVTAWSDFLEGVNSNIGPNYPRFYIGALGFQNYNNGGGYVDPNVFGDLVEYTKDRVGKERFGGVSIWEGTDALNTLTTNGSNILNVTKEALLEPFTSDACVTIAILLHLDNTSLLPIPQIFCLFSFLPRSPRCQSVVAQIKAGEFDERTA